MRLSILIPAHNEEKTIAEVLQKVFIVDLLKIIHHQINLGKGAAIKTALEKATGDYVIIQDADTEYNPSDIPKLLSALGNITPQPPLILRGGESIAVFGKRGTKAYPERGFHYVIGAKLLTWTFNILFGVLFTLASGFSLHQSRRAATFLYSTFSISCFKRVLSLSSLFQTSSSLK